MSSATITLMPRVNMGACNEQGERLAAVRDVNEQELRVALGEEFYVGMGAQRLLGHQVIQVFQEWLANPVPGNVPPEYQFLADQANLGERMQVCLTAWLDHMQALAQERRPRYPERQHDVT